MNDDRHGSGWSLVRRGLLARRTLLVLVVVLVFVGFVLVLRYGPGTRSALESSTSFRCSSCTASIPPRRPRAPTGSQVMERTAGLSEVDREEVILAELGRGNVPSFLRRLVPVALAGRTTSGKLVRATVWVMPDYLSIGSDEDFVRVPINLVTALTVAREFELALPTCKIVDAVYEHSQVRLPPLPRPAGPEMRSNDYYLAHDRAIGEQLAGFGIGRLTAGHKKDLVLTRRLAKKRSSVAIYGWHRSDGSPIQPLSTFHGARYADYSHGVRLVATTVVVDGRRHSLYDVLQDPRLARVLSYEGPMPELERILSPRVGS